MSRRYEPSHQAGAYMSQQERASTIPRFFVVLHPIESARAPKALNWIDTGERPSHFVVKTLPNDATIGHGMKLQSFAVGLPSDTPFRMPNLRWLHLQARQRGLQVLDKACNALRAD